MCCYECCVNCWSMAQSDSRWENIPVDANPCTSLYFTMWGYLDIPCSCLIHSYSTCVLLPNASVRTICSICSNEANSGLSHSCQVNECAAAHGFPWNVVVLFVLGSTQPG